MKLHEYQAKQLFSSAGIPVPRGIIAKTIEQAAHAYEELKKRCGAQKTFECNVKAQLHAGGRGKAGGVLIARSADEALTCAKKLLGQRLVTHQTGPGGLPVSAVLIDERISVSQELYLAITVERSQAAPILLASKQGGVEIELVAESEPDAILRSAFNLIDGPGKEIFKRVSLEFGCDAKQTDTLKDIILGMWKLYESSDASLIEINPLVITNDGRMLALDAKATLDDNALFRHQDLAKMRDESQEDPSELDASRIGISYVGLRGNIGCLVNGAGLAMATNDIIKLSGGEPANFLDVGGGASVEQITKAFSIILADERVRTILVNIFGGIMRCDWIAKGLLNTAQELQIKVPIVVRLEGTSVEEGRKLLSEAKGLNLISCDGLADAAEKVVGLARTDAGAPL